MINRVCPCGTEFETTQKRVDEGRGRYCSRPCMYRYRVRPSGLTYNVTVENRAWFPQGHEPYNKGTGVPKVRPGRPTGERHRLWKGDGASYTSIHQWVYRHFGRAAECELCGSKVIVQWSNRSGEYRRERDDWWQLCKSCHMDYDRNHRGAIARRFGR